MNQFKSQNVFWKSGGFTNSEDDATRFRTNKSPQSLQQFQFDRKTVQSWVGGAQKLNVYKQTIATDEV